MHTVVLSFEKKKEDFLGNPVNLIWILNWTWRQFEVLSLSLLKKVYWEILMLSKYTSSLPDCFAGQLCIFIFLKKSVLLLIYANQPANVIHFLNRFYYGGLTSRIAIVKMLLKEISKDYILIHHHIFLISTQEHPICMREKPRLLKWVLGTYLSCCL